MSSIVRKPAGIIGIALLASCLLLLIIFLPFLPGRYDSLAFGLSMCAQAMTALSLVFVPLGLVWLLIRICAKKSRDFAFCIIAIILLSADFLLLIMISTLAVGFSLAGIFTLAGALILYTLISSVKRWPKSRDCISIALPVCLVWFPVLIFSAAISIAPRAIAYSRQTAIENASELIAELDAYHTANSSYPHSLVSVNKDYETGIVGIDRYEYRLTDQGYNLSFQRPEMLLNNFGTKEYVVYSPNDDQSMQSHAAWIVNANPDDLNSGQGWYAVHDAEVEGWKYFWFD